MPIPAIVLIAAGAGLAWGTWQTKPWISKEKINLMPKEERPPSVEDLDLPKLPDFGNIAIIAVAAVALLALWKR